MDVSQYADSLRRELTAVSTLGGPETAEAGEHLVKAVDAAARLGLIEMLSDAAEEVTSELATTEYPAEVNLQIRGREARLAITPPAFAEPTGPPAPGPAPATEAGADALPARFTLRLPEHLKAQVEHTAATEGLSVNAWIVRAVTAGLQPGGTGRAVHGPTDSDIGVRTFPIGEPAFHGRRIRGYTQG